MNKEKFIIESSSDLDYEKNVINIIVGAGHVATINCDNNADKPEIKIFERFNDKAVWTFDCLDFLEALNKALIKLKEINTKVD